MKIVYIAHPIGGNVKLNLLRIRRIVRQINLEEPDVVPFVPYYADCVSLDDSDPAQRARGINNGLALMDATKFHEIRLYGDRISHGVFGEINKALKKKVKVVPMTEETKKEYNQLWGCK